MGTVKYSSKGRLVFQILYEMQYMVTYIKISIVLLNHNPLQHIQNHYTFDVL